MSQVKFKSSVEGKPVEVVGGWDRPLREFFLGVFPEDDHMEPLWSDLVVSPNMKQDTTFLRGKLSSMGVAAPEGFWERVERKESNVVHVLREQGWQTF